MNDLLKAAKDVIECFDTPKRYYSDRHFADTMQLLRDAVERSEKQEATGFIEWAQNNILLCDPEEPDEVYIGVSVWTAAQQAERERIKNIVRKAIPKKMWVYEQVILEKIDA